MTIRRATAKDADSIWEILEPVIRAGETYTLPRDFSREQALEYWLAPAHEAWVVEEETRVMGTYFLRANQAGGGSHIANCGYVTARGAEGRGIARAMCVHSLERARERASAPCNSTSWLPLTSVRSACGKRSVSKSRAGFEGVSPSGSRLCRRLSHVSRDIRRHKVAAIVKEPCTGTGFAP